MDELDQPLIGLEKIMLFNNDILYEISTHLQLNEKKKLRLINRMFDDCIIKIFFCKYFIHCHFLAENYKIKSKKVVVCRPCKLCDQYVKRFNLNIVIPNHVTHFNFEIPWSKFLYLGSSVTHLTFGPEYYKKTTIPSSVTHLKFGRDYNRHTTVPNSVTHLTFRQKYNQPIVVPESVLHLTFGENYDQPTIIPESVSHLIFGKYYNQPINIPDSVTYLILGARYSHSIVLPNSVKHLEFGIDYNLPTILPASLTYLKFGFSYNQETHIPNSVEYLKFGFCYNIPTKLPGSLTSLKFGWKYNQPTDFQTCHYITKLKLGSDYNHPTIIPNSVGILTICPKYKSTIFNIITNPITHLVLEYVSEKCHNYYSALPSSLTSLKLNFNYFPNWRQKKEIKECMSNVGFTYWKEYQPHGTISFSLFFIKK